MWGTSWLAISRRSSAWSSTPTFTHVRAVQEVLVSFWPWGTAVDVFPSGEWPSLSLEDQWHRLIQTTKSLCLSLLLPLRQRSLSRTLNGTLREIHLLSTISRSMSVLYTSQIYNPLATNSMKNKRKILFLASMVQLVLSKLWAINSKFLEKTNNSKMKISNINNPKLLSKVASRKKRNQNNQW